MSDVPGELARVRTAFDQPTLTLLHQRAAPVIIAIFRTSFGRDTQTVPVARLHDQVDTYIADLKLAGVPDLPAGDGSTLCRRWMHDQWLRRPAVNADSPEEVYALTSHAQEALSLVTSLTRDRANLSEHRIANIIGAVRRFNAEANPDPRARVDILETEIARLTRERDRIIAGGTVPDVTADYMLEGYTEILQMVTDLPRDFARVQEVFANLRTDILASFRADDRPAGQVIDDYLRRADNLTATTAEGRAFEGAFQLFRDDELELQLRQDLRDLLDHPLADDILLDGDRRELRGIVSLISRGLTDGLEQRSRVSATLHEYIATRDLTRDRELDVTLRQIEDQLTTWVANTGPRTTNPLPLLPARADVAHLRERFHDPVSDTAPPPLQHLDDNLPDTLSLEDLRRHGGPTLDALRHALDDWSSAQDATDTSLAQMFSNFDDDLRRPVEVLGLLHLAANLATRLDPDQLERYRTLRPDGTSRDFDGPRIVLDTAAGRHPEPHLSSDPSSDPSATTADRDQEYP